MEKGKGHWKRVREPRINEIKMKKIKTTKDLDRVLAKEKYAVKKPYVPSWMRTMGSKTTDAPIKRTASCTKEERDETIKRYESNGFTLDKSTRNHGRYNLIFKK